jgi:hypothetical protein
MLATLIKRRCEQQGGWKRFDLEEKVKMSRKKKKEEKVKNVID